MTCELANMYWILIFYLENKVQGNWHFEWKSVCERILPTCIRLRKLALLGPVMVHNCTFHDEQNCGFNSDDGWNVWAVIWKICKILPIPMDLSVCARACACVCTTIFRTCHTLPKIKCKFFWVFLHLPSNDLIAKIAHCDLDLLLKVINLKR